MLLDGTPPLHPRRDLHLFSVCLWCSHSRLPKGSFFSPLPAASRSVASPADPAGTPRAHQCPLLLPSLPSPTSALQQRAGCLPQRRRRTLKVCIIDQRALIRIALSVSELTGLGKRWGLTPSGCNFPHSGSLFFLLPEYPSAVWDLLGRSDGQRQLPASQPVLDAHRRGQPRFPGCWHRLLSSPFLPRLAQLAVWFYLRRHLRVYNHDQLLHLCPTGNAATSGLETGTFSGF